MKKILVCEDEMAIREFVVWHLQRAGFTVIETASGEDALKQAAEQTVDVAILDVMLPGIDGFEVCRQLRQQDAFMGIVMLTARSQETEKISGLQYGADDYVTKPFSPAELLARIEALYRRVQLLKNRQQSEVISRGQFALYLRDRVLKHKNEQVTLTHIEFEILEYLFSHAGECLTREDILHTVWGEDFVGDDKVVDVNIRRLRMKTETDPSAPRHLLTVWGKGYMWQD